MTSSEFSNEFDILYNNIMSNQAPGLNGYEKSVLLTQAQESLLLDIYTGKFNESSFEYTEEVSSYLNTLVKQEEITSTVEGTGISENSVFYSLPEDLWFITYEEAKLDDTSLGCKNGKSVLVKPITQDTYNLAVKNPFRGPNSNRVLRLLIDNKAELISKYKIKSYTVRYISNPSPIIVENLSDYGTPIKGITGVTECKLNPASHRIILNRAVVLAKELWASGK